MTQAHSLRRSIGVSTLIYYILQCGVWVVSVSPNTAVRNPYLWFFPTSAVLHAGMVAFLLWRSEDFRHTETREPLSAVNAACHLTLFRLSCVPTIVFLAIGVVQDDASGLILIALAAIAFFSDLLDGQVARRFNQTTDIGRYLDSSTDYAVLVVFAIGFVIMKVTPVWYFAILMGRFVGFAIAMFVLAKVQRKVSAETTFLGKASVFGAMTTIVFEICRYSGLVILGDATLVLVLEIISAMILGISVVDKLVYLVRKFRPVSQSQDSPSAP